MSAGATTDRAVVSSCPLLVAELQPVCDDELRRTPLLVEPGDVLQHCDCHESRCDARIKHNACPRAPTNGQVSFCFWRSDCAMPFHPATAARRAHRTNVCLCRGTAHPDVSSDVQQLSIMQHMCMHGLVKWVLCGVSRGCSSILSNSLHAMFAVLFAPWHHTRVLESERVGTGGEVLMVCFPTRHLKSHDMHSNRRADRRADVVDLPQLLAGRLGCGNGMCKACQLVGSRLQHCEHSSVDRQISLHGSLTALGWAGSAAEKYWFGFAVVIGIAAVSQRLAATLLIAGSATR